MNTEGIISEATTHDGKGKSPSPKDYGTDSEAKINYDAILKAVKSINY